MISYLILAWILTLFNFDEIFINAMKELFDADITIATYYFVFAILGLIFNKWVDCEWILNIVWNLIVRVVRNHVNRKEVRAMANEQNLRPITNSEIARELQEKSVEKRKENQEKKKTFRAMLELALEEINKETGKTKREEINDAIIDRALKGDTKAYEVIRDTVGEKPADKLQANVFNYEDSLKAVDGDEY